MSNTEYQMIKTSYRKYKTWLMDNVNTVILANEIVRNGVKDTGHSIQTMDTIYKNAVNVRNTYAEFYTIVKELEDILPKEV